MKRTPDRSKSKLLPGFSSTGASIEKRSLYSHPAVALYRRICERKPNLAQRQAIADCVGEETKSLALYEEVLTQFMEEGRPPQRVDWTLERFVKALPVPIANATVTEPDSVPDVTPEELARLGISPR